MLELDQEHSAELGRAADRRSPGGQPPSPSYWLVERTPTRVIDGWPATVSYAY
jgi:hypothetical protein